MDWLRSEDLKEEKDVTAPVVIIADPGPTNFGLPVSRVDAGIPPRRISESNS